LTEGFFLIDHAARKATIIDGGHGKFNTTLKSTVGLAVANILSLPEVALSVPGPSLEDFKNKFCYISSFLTSQRKILDSVQRATSSRDEDWKIESLDGAAYVAEGKEMLGRGEMRGMVNVLGGLVLVGADGANYENKKGVSNEILGLEEEDMDAVVKELLKDSEKA
jgi:hypothetical protein